MQSLVSSQELFLASIGSVFTKCFSLCVDVPFLVEFVVAAQWLSYSLRQNDEV